MLSKSHDSQRALADGCTWVGDTRYRNTIRNCTNATRNCRNKAQQRARTAKITDRTQDECAMWSEDGFCSRTRCSVGRCASSLASARTSLWIARLHVEHKTGLATRTLRLAGFETHRPRRPGMLCVYRISQSASFKAASDCFSWPIAAYARAYKYVHR